MSAPPLVARNTSLAVRIVVPEWLDTLPPDDPRALRSRRDLVVVNALMGNARALAAALRRSNPQRIAELGGGTARVLARVSERARLGHAVDAILVDLNPSLEDRTRRRFQDQRWNVTVAKEDVFAWLELQADGSYDAIVANLFLHHFEDRDLRRMLALAARKTRCFIACEPRRSRFAECAAHLLPLLGCNDVTHHDAVVSVRAGFAGTELSSLWTAAGWRCDERRWGPFTHRFIATQDGDP